MTSFLPRTIDVKVDQNTWITSPVPANLQRASGNCSIDVGKALHMLGSLTMPNSLSPASPALFWAWLRYYLAPTTSSDLRLTMDFADLDPHQKGILSDDFGVAISTQWLVDRLGGYKRIVDGRKFILQFPRLLRKINSSTAKVGPGKTPDFVILDLSGKWHVLECKGTQTKSHQSKSLKVALAQKKALQIAGSIKGEQLAASLYIAHEQEGLRTQLRVIDPDDPALIELSDNDSEEMEIKAHRVAVARALGTIGLNEVAIELTLPSELDPESVLLRPSEASRVRSSRDARYARASEQTIERRLVDFEHEGRRFEGREVQFELPPIAAGIPFRRVTIRQGVARDLIEELGSREALMGDSVDDRLSPFGKNTRITNEANGAHLTLSEGTIMFSEMIWE